MGQSERSGTRVAVALLGFGLLSFAACQESTDIIEPVSAAVARGTIRNSEGAGLANAAIRGGFCVSSDLNEWQSQTNALGEYELLMNLFSGIDLEWCVVLIAEAPPGSTLKPDTMRVESVLFRAEGPADTIDVNFLLSDDSTPGTTSEIQ